MVALNKTLIKMDHAGCQFFLDIQELEVDTIRPGFAPRPFKMQNDGEYSDSEDGTG